LFDGAGDLDANAFQERLDDAGAEIGFDASRDFVYGSMRMLADQKDEALGLLRLAIELRASMPSRSTVCSQIVSGIVASAKDPDHRAICLGQALYGEHPYSRRDQGTQETLAGISADDLRALHKRLSRAATSPSLWSVQSMPETLARQLHDKLFGVCRRSLRCKRSQGRGEARPGNPFLRPAAPTLQLAYPGIDGTIPSFCSIPHEPHPRRRVVHVAAFQRVREKRGLAYSIDSSLVNNEHSSGHHQGRRRAPTVRPKRWRSSARSEAHGGRGRERRNLKPPRSMSSDRMRSTISTPRVQ
jgi:zinc protease